MSVAYHGVDLERFRPPIESERRAALDLLAGPSRWIAFLGTLEPRKNVGNLVRAFEELTLGGARPDLDLVLIGGRGWDTGLDTLIDRSSVSARIHRLGFVDDALLAGLLGGADLVAYPSLGEGFGLPVLEAMASGAPVVTTRLLALPEVGGDVAVYSEPDPASLAIAIASVLDNDSLRDDLRGRGVERARSFTWAASADAHLRVFRAVAQEGRRP
jgi:glycosyltransferase involved in cell wall biosynthesis